MFRFLPILLFAFGLTVTTDDIYDNSYALIIGIDKYEKTIHLRYAVKDAESIQSIIVEYFDFPKENVRLLLNEEATFDNIRKQFLEISNSAQEQDRVLLFFAGHGDQEVLPGGGEVGYLIPVEGDPEDLYLTAIPMDEMRQMALRSRAKHMLYLVDACYGGIAAIGTRGVKVATKTSGYIEKVTTSQGRQVITAGGRGEKVLEKDEWGHSAFTLNLQRGLKDGDADMDGDRYITGNELAYFLTKKVSIDSENMQTPQYGHYTSQEGEFVFVLPEKTKAVEAEDDNSSDDKFAEILQKLEKLESQKNADTPLKKQNNNIENVGISGPYWQKELGIGFFATPTMTSFEFYNSINDHLELSVQYEHSIDKISSLLSGTQSNQIHLGKLSVIYSYVLNERYRLLLGGGLGYVQVLWTDSTFDFNYFKTSAIGGLGVNIIKTHKPISTQIGCKLLFEISDQPHLDENGEGIFDKKIDIKPKIIFLISFPG